MSKRKLEWGQTPWDDLSREELLREVQRMYVALSAARGVLVVSALENPVPYWSQAGVGGRAITKVYKALSRLESFDSESVYRAFFRYANDLLFGEEEDGWTICDQCEGMRASVLPREESQIGRPCPDCYRKGITSVLRRITWEDLKPRPPAPPAKPAADEDL